MQGKWDAYSRSSAFRTYIYNNAGQENAPFFSPGVDDDEAKWEEAFRKRPDPGFVPILTRGFFELGKRAQVEKDHATRLQWRLHQVDDCLNSLLSCHDLKISVRIADARRKHIVLSKRCLALAAKTQVLRNRGYAMDEAEEELKSKLAQLERAVFDPSLNGRSEEIWARMVAIRDRSTRLKQQIANAGPGVSGETNGELDEETMKTARKVSVSPYILETG